MGQLFDEQQHVAGGESVGGAVGGGGGGGAGGPPGHSSPLDPNCRLFKEQPKLPLVLAAVRLTPCHTKVARQQFRTVTSGLSRKVQFEHMK